MTYYRVDLRNLTFGELWRIARLSFPVAALLKILRIPLNLRTAIAYPPIPIRLDDHELDVEGRRARLRRDFDLLEEAGVRYRFPYKVPMVSPETSTLGVAFLADDGRIAGVVLDSVSRIGTKTRVLEQVALSTLLRDGRVLVTTSKALMKAPPDVDGEVVRRGTRRLVERHLQRLRDEVAGVRFIPEDQLLAFLEERERRSADFQIQRKVWVPMSTAQVEKLRGGRARGRGWQLGQQALAWGVALTLGMGWSVGGIGSCGGWTATPEAESLLAGEDLSRFDCSSSAGDATEVGQPGPHLTSVTAVFPTGDEAAAALAAARAAWEGSGEAGGALARLDRVVFFRLAQGDRQAARPVYELWKEGALSTTVLGGEPVPGEAPPTLVISRKNGPEPDRGRGETFESYVELGPQFQLTPPWATPGEAGAAVVTSEQENARRTVRRLQQAELDALAEEWSGPFPILRTLWQTFTADEDDWAGSFEAMQEERLENLRAIADRLPDEDPTLDARALELYLAWQEETGLVGLAAMPESDPFAAAATEGPDVPGAPGESAAWRELRERLGGLSRTRDEASGLLVVDDPRKAFAAAWGTVVRSDEELAGRIGLADPAVAAPAILRWLCGDAGADTEVRYAISEEAW